MITIGNVEVFGWEAAIRGMRNPMNSWAKSDSYWTHIENPETLNTANFEFFVGDEDLGVMESLASAGSDRGKFMRMVGVSLDITAPLYWWKEFDTYKVGTVANSCSTMHKIAAKPFELEDFSFEHCENDAIMFATMHNVIDTLNMARREYICTGDKVFWWDMIQLLPSSYNQKRTITLNYEVLRNMYHARKNHKLDEWRALCEWIEGLPYAKELICGVHGVDADGNC